MGDVSLQLGAASGRIDADHGATGEGRRTQPQGELGDVVQQHARVERSVDALLQQIGGARGAGLDILLVAPGLVFET